MTIILRYWTQATNVSTVLGLLRNEGFPMFTDRVRVTKEEGTLYGSPIFTIMLNDPPFDYERRLEKYGIVLREGEV